MVCPRRIEIRSFSSEFIPMVLLTVPRGTWRSYAPVNCTLAQDPARDPLPQGARTARSRPTFTVGRSAYACLRDCCRIRGREIAISRWIDFRSSQDNLGGCNTTPIPCQYRDHKSGSPCRPFLPADERTGQIFLCYRRGQEASLSVAWTRRSVWGSDRFVEPFFLSLQHRNGNGQFDVGVGSPSNSGSCGTVSQIAGKCIGNCVRFPDLASRILHRFSLLHCSTSGCSSTRHSWPDHRQERSGWC